MSFIQCKDRKEVEEKLETIPVAFVTEDHRIYDKIELSDENCFNELDPKVLEALMSLKHNIEFCSEGFMETALDELEHHAKEIRTAFLKVKALLGSSNGTKERR